MQTICTSLRTDNHTGVTEIMQNEQCPISVQQVVLSASWRKAGLQRVILWSVGECWLLGWVGERGLWQRCGQDTVITGPTSEAEAASSRLESWSTDMLLLQGTYRTISAVFSFYKKFKNLPYVSFWLPIWGLHHECTLMLLLPCSWQQWTDALCLHSTCPLCCFQETLGFVQVVSTVVPFLFCELESGALTRPTDGILIIFTKTNGCLLVSK